MRTVKEVEHSSKNIVRRGGVLEWMSYADPRFVKFIFFGGLNTLLCFVIYCFGIKLGFNYVAANSLSWIIGVLVAFMLNKTYIFKSRYQHKKLLLFVGSNVLSLIISLAMLSILIKCFHVNTILASIISIPCVVAANFLAFKHVIFKVTS